MNPQDSNPLSPSIAPDPAPGFTPESTSTPVSEPPQNLSPTSTPDNSANPFSPTTPDMMTTAAPISISTAPLATSEAPKKSKIGLILGITGIAIVALVIGFFAYRAISKDRHVSCTSSYTDQYFNIESKISFDFNNLIKKFTSDYVFHSEMRAKTSEAKFYLSALKNEAIKECENEGTYSNCDVNINDNILIVDEKMPADHINANWIVNHNSMSLDEVVDVLEEPTSDGTQMTCKID